MGTSKDSAIYVKDDLTKSAGDRIRIGLRMQLSQNGVTGDSTLEGNEESLTTYTDNLFIDQLRHAVRSGGEMSEQRVPFSVREEAMDALRDWIADKIDTSFFNQVCGVSTETNIQLTGMQAATAPTSAASNTRILYGSGATSTTASYTATSSASASAKGLIFTPACIDVAVNVAKTATPLIRPIKIDGQSKYLMFIHPNQTRQLRTNNAANTVTWYDIMRARAEGGESSATNPIYNGALGEYNGVILHESTRIPGWATGTANGSSTKKAVLCGAQAACFGTGQRDSGNQVKWVEELNCGLHAPATVH
jgi:N4-gp56 family major capsid protein